MNPLTREHKRRRSLVTMVMILVVPFTIGLAGVVGPSFQRHRDVTSRAFSDASRHEDLANRTADLIAFKQSRLDSLLAAEAAIAALTPEANLPTNYREVTRDRLETDGVHLSEIVTDVGDDDAPDTDGLPFDVIRVDIVATVEYPRLREFLERLPQDDRPVVVERVDIERKSDELHELEVNCSLAYLRRKIVDAPNGAR